MSAAMGSRERIFAALRGTQIPEAPRPDLSGLGCITEDLATTFTKQLEAAGGRCWQVESLAEFRAKLGLDPGFQSAARRYSTIPGIMECNIACEADTDGASLDGLDLALLQGELAVAENGAVWLSHDALAHRALPFICSSLYLVVDASLLVPDLHAAYAHLHAVGRTGGSFIAGPSKTADIEQCLVIGAQGPKQATVVLVASA
jgi:L-lactate dehydrogenase complex protein LldG